MIYNYNGDKEFANRILNAGCDLFNVTREELLSKSRPEPLASIRTVVFMAMLKGAKLSKRQLAMLVERTRGALIFHEKRHDTRMQSDRKYAKSYKTLEEQIENWKND